MGVPKKTKRRKMKMTKRWSKTTMMDEQGLAGPKILTEEEFKAENL